MVDLVLLVYVVVYPILGAVVVWRRLGGWPEAYWRIRRIPYFCVHIFDAAGFDNRYVLKTEEIQHKSQAGFNLNGKYRLMSEEDTARDTGRPALYYNYNEMRPIPIFRWLKEIPKWDASLVGAAYENHSIEDMHRIGHRGLSQFQLIVVALIALTLIVAAVGVYFSYNNFCALDPARCASGNGGIRIG